MKGVASGTKHGVRGPSANPDLWSTRVRSIAPSSVRSLTASLAAIHSDAASQSYLAVADPDGAVPAGREGGTGSS
jgi:hypothetical protein